MSDQNTQTASDQGTQNVTTSMQDVQGNVDQTNVNASQDTSLNENAETTLDSNAEKATRAKYAKLESDNNELKRQLNEAAQAQQILKEVNSMLEEDKELYSAFEKRAKVRKGEPVETKDEPLKDNKSSKESGGVIDEKKIESTVSAVIQRQREQAEFVEAVRKFNEKHPEFDPANVSKLSYIEQQKKQEEWQRIFAAGQAQKIAGNKWEDSLNYGYYFQPENRDKYFDAMKKDAELAKKASDLSNSTGSEAGFTGNSGTGGADESISAEEIYAMKKAGLDPSDPAHKKAYIEMRKLNG